MHFMPFLFFIFLECMLTWWDKFFYMQINFLCFFPAITYLYHTNSLLSPFDKAANQAKHLKIQNLWRTKDQLSPLWMLAFIVLQSYNSVVVRKQKQKINIYQLVSQQIKKEAVCEFLSAILGPNYPTDKLISKHFLTHYLSFLRAPV